MFDNPNLDQMRDEEQKFPNEWSSLSEGLLSSSPLESHLTEKAAMRSDVVVKGIMRAFRKYHIQRFNESTGYMKMKRYRSKEFFPACLA